MLLLSTNVVQRQWKWSLIRVYEIYDPSLLWVLSCAIRVAEQVCEGVRLWECRIVGFLALDHQIPLSWASTQFRMFSSEKSPNGFSLHRSPPYASKTPPKASVESPGIASPGARLQLTLKTPYASKAAPVLENFVDPSPDWTLRDLQSELDVIATRYTSTVSLDNEPPRPSTNRGWVDSHWHFILCRDNVCVYDSCLQVCSCLQFERGWR